MGMYQGRALERETRAAPRGVAHPSRRSGPRLPAALRTALVLAALAALAFGAARAWGPFRARVARLQHVRVEGARYLDGARVAAVAGLHPGDDLVALDLDRARQRLLLDPRIARAEVTRAWPRDVLVRIQEREPVLLVRHDVPWEVDSAGVLLPPLARGVVADVPLLTGPDFSGFRAGTQVLTPEVRRGLAWVRILGARDLQLAGEVSEVDVADPGVTDVVLMNGTRVLAPAWPPGARTLSALRVVLEDLRHRGVAADEVDLRFEGQVVVRPAGAPVPPERLLEGAGAGTAGADPSGGRRSG
jgi:cell division protein FtsQ